MLEDTAFSADVAFQKDAAGESTVVGQFVNESGQARGLGRIHGGKIYSYQVRHTSRVKGRVAAGGGRGAAVTLAVLWFELVKVGYLACLLPHAHKKKKV